MGGFFGAEPFAHGSGRNPLDAWFDAAAVAPLGLGGFSGAPLFRVEPAGGGPPCVLKAFAADTTRSRAEWVHELVRHLRGQGCEEIPELLPSRSGDTLVRDRSGTLWELQRLVDGAPADAPTPARAATALEALARVHRAAASLPGAAPARGPSAGVARRCAQAVGLVARPWRARRPPAPTRDAPADPLAPLWDEALRAIDRAEGRRAVAAVAAAEIPPVTCQTVLRDVWSAHVLFALEEAACVTGIVDLHAAAVDTPATDLARLLGSWTAPPGREGLFLLERWPEALAAYESVRPLEPRERRMVPFLHAAGVVCGLDNWFRWTLEETRRFPDPEAVRARVTRLLGELPAALAWLAEPGSCRV